MLIPLNESTLTGKDQSVCVSNNNNQLIIAAMPLLLLLMQIKKLVNHSEPKYLHQQIINEIHLFEQRARAAGCLIQHILAARYCLITALDEFILLTDWGVHSIWSQQSLLSVLYKETWGGERFFIIIEKMSEEPKKNLILLEFLYILLSLGFEGKYYNEEKAIHDNIKYQLFSLIMRYRGIHKSQNFSINLENLPKQTNKTNYFTKWKAFTITSVATLIVSIILNMLTLASVRDSLNQFNQINKLSLPYILPKFISKQSGEAVKNKYKNHSNKYIKSLYTRKTKIFPNYSLPLVGEDGR